MLKYDLGQVIRGGNSNLTHIYKKKGGLAGFCGKRMYINQISGNNINIKCCILLRHAVKVGYTLKRFILRES